MKQDPIDSPSKRLHKALLTDEWDVPSDFDEFVNRMSDPETSGRLHKALLTDGWDVPKDTNEFNTAMGFENQYSLKNQLITEPRKKKAEEEKRFAGMPDFNHSSFVDAPTARPTSSQIQKSKENVDAYEQTLTENPDYTVEDSYKNSILKKNGGVGEWNFLASGVAYTSQDKNSINTPFDAKDSKKSYELSRDAFKYNSQLLSSKLEQIKSVPASLDILSQATNILSTIEDREAILNKGEYKGEKLNDVTIAALNKELSDLSTSYDDLKQTPDGQAVTTWISKAKDLDSYNEKLKNNFKPFVDEEVAKYKKQQLVDATWFTKSLSNDWGAPVLATVGRGISSGIASMIAMPFEGFNNTTLNPSSKELENDYKKISKIIKSGIDEDGDKIGSDKLKDYQNALEAVGSELKKDTDYGWRNAAADWVNDVHSKLDSELLPRPSSYNGSMIDMDSGFDIKGFDEKGKLSPSITLPKNVSVNSNVLPKIADMATQMAMLIAPATIASKSKALAKIGVTADAAFNVALVASSFVQSHHSLLAEAKELGLTHQQATEYASRGAAFESLLELVNPRAHIFRAGKIADKTALKYLSSGGGKMATLKSAALDFSGENIQEQFQMVGGIVNKSISDRVNGANNFDINSKDVTREFLETAALTSILTSATSAASVFTNPLYGESIRAMAENPSMLKKLKEEFVKKNISTNDVDRVLKDIASIVNYKPDEVGYVNTRTNLPLTKEQANQMIADGNIGSLQVFNDQETENSLIQKANEMKAARDKEREGVATRIVKNEDGSVDIVLKNDPTKKVGSIDPSTGKVTKQEEEKIKPEAVKEEEKTEEQVKAERIYSIDELIRTNEIALVTEEQAKVMSTNGDADNRKLGSVITNITKVMMKISPKARLVMLESKEQAKAVANKLGYLPVKDKNDEISGFYDRDTKTAFFVRNPNVAIHESVIHPIIDLIKQEHPEVYPDETLPISLTKF